MSFHIRDHYKAKVERSLREVWLSQDAHNMTRPSEDILRDREFAIQKALDELDEQWDAAELEARSRPTVWDHLLETT